MGERAIEAILGIDQITIAAWNGAAMGGGACLATACDFRIGSDDCFIQYPEIDIGMNPKPCQDWVKHLPMLPGHTHDGFDSIRDTHRVAAAAIIRAQPHVCCAGR